MKTVHGSGYDIHIGEGLLAKAGDYLAAFPGRKAFVVSDTKVTPLYGAQLLAVLKEAGMAATLVAVPEGEGSKSPEMLFYLYGKMAEIPLSRQDVVLALGGGVVGDLAGFAAATYMRGLNFVQLPTTLLAQVDSSVGGKVAIDLPQGKNMAGTFYNPKVVLADVAVLKTLESRQWSAGMAEVIKYGCIKDQALFYQIAKGKEQQNLTELVARCIAIKQEYAALDPYDRGIRAQLNFGHTLGHAIESALGYNGILHGEGVAIGMAAAARLSEKMGLAPRGTAQDILQVLLSYDLPVKAPAVDRKLVADALQLDKKGAGRLVLLKSIGQAVVEQVPDDVLEQLLEGIGL